MKLFVVFLSLLARNAYSEDEGILCSAKTCSDYISSNPCPSLPANCQIQNSTHNGLFLPSPDPCNCCDYCLENLKENDYCTPGEVGGLVPNSICGPGLYCLEGTCVKMSQLDAALQLPCSKEQGDYDKRREDGTLGFLETRPECDDDGYYASYKCIPGQTCFCINRMNGSRTFGEITYTSAAHLILKCECSSNYYEILKFFDGQHLHPNQHFRCTDTGDYDTIQCIGDQCMCTDSLDGAPTYPTQATVDINTISNTTLPECFNGDIHETGKYYHTCAENYLKILEEVEAYQAEGYNAVFEIEYPKCDLSGNFQPVQKATDVDGSEYFFCANSDGTPIGTYRSTDSSTMDCQCARSKLLMPEGAFERPDCCLNGNFNRVQCRRGKCYCVDETGYQVVKDGTTIQLEVDIDSKDQLFCYIQEEQDQCRGSS